ncbi:integrase core domain-containing protein [Pseudoalteromonas gelatinilytica]
MLKQYGIQSSMGSKGACWDNAVVERFFGSLKHEWLYQVFQPTRDHAIGDIKEFIRYYNVERPHGANGDRSPVDYEFYERKVSGNG